MLRDTVDLHEVLERSYVHASVGLLDLYFPAGSTRDLDHYKRLTVALCEAQSKWLEWTGEVSVDGRQARKDAQVLTKWAKSWELSSMIEGIQAGERDVLVLTGAKRSVVDASGRLAECMTRGSCLGLAREDGPREPIVLVPDRGDFTRFMAFGGWLYPAHQATFWQPSVVDWTHTYIDDIKILSTRFAAAGRSPGDYTSSMSMDYRSPTGMEQQIVQLTANSMFANYYGERISPSLAGALAVNLVIDLYGECNTRVDGDLRARRTSAREIFVPGGNPDGGILPPNLADSRWRDTHGADHFVSVLKGAIKGSKERSSSRRRKGASTGSTFILLSDSGREQLEIQGPFLGGSASAAPVPQEFFGDQLEFLRSYRSCFMHWLRTEGGGSASRSERAFATLLRDMALNDDPEGLEQVFADIYRMPLSGLVEKGDDLESEFLSWLPKAKS